MEYDSDKADEIVLAPLCPTVAKRMTGEHARGNRMTGMRWTGSRQEIYRRREEQSEIVGAEPSGIDRCAKVVSTALRAKSTA
jgi:hypothetical protein